MLACRFPIRYFLQDFAGFAAAAAVPGAASMVAAAPAPSGTLPRWEEALTPGQASLKQPNVTEQRAVSSPEPRSRRSRPVLQQWQDLSLEVHACLKVAVHSSSRQAASKGASQKQGREQTPRVGQLQSLMQSQASLVT